MKKNLKKFRVFITITIILGLISVNTGTACAYMKGVGTHFTHFDDTEKDLPLLYESGVKTIRDTINWSGVEKQEGIYKWNNYDWWMNELEENGIEAYICVLASKPLYYTDTSKSYFSTEKEIESFCEFLKAMIERYPSIRYIELWNEPNLSFGNNASAEERMQCYINMVKAASKTIRQMNPDIEIIGGCVANDDSIQAPKITGTTFLKTVIPEIYPYIDAVSMHVYVTPKTAESSVMESRISAIDDILGNAGGWKKLYASEVGWPTGSNMSVSVSEKAQAENTVKIMSIMEEHDYAGTYIYDFRNDGTDKTNTEHNFGIINYDRTVKPAYNSFKEYLSKTSDYNYLGKFEANGYEKHLYVGEEDAVIIKWDIPESSFISETPEYETGVTLNNAKEMFKKILASKYTELENKVSGTGVNISGEITKLKGYVSSGKEEELFYANYELGNTLIDMQLTGKIKMEAEELSSVLYDLYLIGDKMTKIYDISAEVFEDDILRLNEKCEAIKKTTDVYDTDSLVLSNAIVNMSEEKIREIGKNTTVKVNGEKDGINYALSGDSVLSISGDAAIGSFVSLKVEKSGEFVYADTVCADADGKFDLQIPLNGENGIYDVVVGKSSGECISFSVEKKTRDLSMEYIQTQYILDYAVQMLLVTGYDSVVVYSTQEVSDNILKTQIDIKCGYEPQNIRALSGKYTDERLMECAYEPVELKSGQSASITLENSYTNEDSIYKTFVWDENMTPYKTVIKNY